MVSLAIHGGAMRWALKALLIQTHKGQHGTMCWPQQVQCQKVINALEAVTIAVEMMENEPLFNAGIGL